MNPKGSSAMRERAGGKPTLFRMRQPGQTRTTVEPRIGKARNSSSGPPIEPNIIASLRVSAASALRFIRFRRLLPLPLRARALVALDVLIDRDAGDGVADDVERQIVELLEVDAAAAHVEPLARFLVGDLELSPDLRVTVDGHEIERHHLRMRAERREHQR